MNTRRKRALAAVLALIGRLRGYWGKYDEYLQLGPTEIVQLELLPVARLL